MNAPAPTCWEANGRLVALDGAALPARCVRCNGTLGLAMRRQTFTWKPPAAQLLGVAAVAISRRSTLTFGVCARHRRSKRMIVSAALSLLGLGLAAIAGSKIAGRPTWSLAGLGLIVAAGILWSFTHVLWPRSYDRSGATVYTGAGRAFLAALCER
jgi:ABC-type uncharacterized transport system permease subunit